MSSVFPLPDEGDEVQGPGLPKPIRLSNVIEIAAERLDGVADGSLKEALAVRAVELPATLEPNATDDADALPLSLGSDLPTPLAVAPPVATSAEPQPVGGSEPTQTPQSSPSVAATDKPTAMPEPVSSADTTQASETGAVERPAPAPETATDASGDGPEPPIALSVTPAPETNEVEREVAGDAGAEHASDLARDVVKPGDDAIASQGETSITAPPPVTPPTFPAEAIQAVPWELHARSSQHPVDPAPDVDGSSPEPLSAASPVHLSTSAHSEKPGTPPRLVNAIDAAAKLAADATAASEAIENLKRLLERQLPNPPQAPRQPLDEVFAREPTAHAPPPLPAHEPPAAPELQDHEPAQAAEKPLPRRSATRTRALRERRQFDVRGFMAGFALSWAIGAVLYIYLTAG